MTRGRYGCGMNVSTASMSLLDRLLAHFRVLVFEDEGVSGRHPDAGADLFALKGDAIDNIPGAPGIGDKGARDLIERFGSVEAAIARAGEVERKMYRESLQNNVERILMSKRLATIDTAVPIEFDLDSVRAREPDPDALKQVYKDLEFHSLLKELGPGEDTRTRDYQALEPAAAVAEWLRTIPADAPVAVAIAESGAGEFALDIGLDIAQAMIGMAWKSGEARSARSRRPHRWTPLSRGSKTPRGPRSRVT